MRMTVGRRVAGGVLAGLVLLGGQSAGAAAESRARAGILVFAAASLKEALDENLKAFEARRGGWVVASYAGSSALARQIERGAPAEIYISADRDWMDYLQQRGLIQAGTRIDLLTNRLVLIVPAHSKTTIEIRPRFPLSAMIGNERLAMADPDTVPAGKYGRAALESLGVWKAVSGKTARAENVRAALALVARGEAPVGIVYRTDAAAERDVRVTGTFDARLHPAIVYPAAILAGSRSKTASAFLAYLGGPAARAVWMRHGFEPVR